VSSDFYATSIVPFAPIIIKICRAYRNTQEDFEDYYQEVCLQIAGVVATAIVVDLLGGVIFDFDVNTVYRSVFRKLDQMVAEMEELRG
jgi:hypothetical protein